MRTAKEVRTRIECYEDLIDNSSGKIGTCENWVLKRIKNQISQLKWVLENK